jgi:hypothetical protein
LIVVSFGKLYNYFMKVLVLTIILTTSLYLVTKDKRTEVPKIDSIKVKISAPQRNEVHENLSRPVKLVEETILPNQLLDPKDDNFDTSEDDSSEPYRGPAVEGVALKDLEEGWNAELKDLLMRLEPAEAEEIYKAYLEEQEGHQAQLDALVNEKHQKSSDEGVAEIDQLTEQLEQRHNDRMKEILGAHYQAVQDHFEQYMDSVQPVE